MLGTKLKMHVLDLEVLLLLLLAAGYCTTLNYCRMIDNNNINTRFR